MKILIYTILILMGIWPLYALIYCLENSNKLSHYFSLTLMLFGAASIGCCAVGIANKSIYGSVFGEQKD